MLYALSGYIPCDGRVFAFSGDLIDFIDVDNSLFCPLDVIVCRLKQPYKHIFHIIADITGFGQCRCVRDRERNAKVPGQRLDEIGLAGTGRADHQNIALFKFNIRTVPAADSLIVVVNSHGDGSFGSVLANYVLIQEIHDLTGFFQIRFVQKAALVLFLIRFSEAVQNIIGRLDAVLTNNRAAASDESFSRGFRFSAEQAFGFFFCHFRLLSIFVCRQVRRGCAWQIPMISEKSHFLQ